jgi:hypothetical protein
MPTIPLDWLSWITAAVLCAPGMMLVHRALAGDRACGRRRCPKCWYQMTGVPSLRCPECGREATDENDLHRRRRRWRLAATGFVIAAAVPGWKLGNVAIDQGWYYALLPKWVVEDELFIGRFRVTTDRTRNPHAWLQSRARITLDYSVVLELTAPRWSVGSGHWAEPRQVIGRGEDLTGNGIPDVILQSHSGGNGCYDKSYLIELDENEAPGGLRVLAAVDYCGDFEDRTADGLVEFVAHDRTFECRWTSCANSPAPEVILSFRGGMLLLDLELMRRPPLTAAEVDQRIAGFRNDRDGWDGRFAALLDVVLYLIYSGNPEQGWHLLRERWPTAPGQITLEQFEPQLRETLRESPFSAAIPWLTAAVTQADDP